MRRGRAAGYSAVLGFLLGLVGCQEDGDSDAVPESELQPDLGEQCGFEGLELDASLGDTRAFIRCSAGVSCSLHDAFMSSLRAHVDVDLGPNDVSEAMVWLSPRTNADAMAVVLNGSELLELDPCTQTARVRFELLVLRPGDVDLEIEAATPPSGLVSVGTWPLHIADPAEIAIEQDGGDPVVDRLELQAGDAVTLAATVLDADGEALTTLGSELWWADDGAVLTARSEAGDGADADAGVGVFVPAGPPARGSLVVVEALAPGETELHVLAGNVERVVPVVVTR